jgi:hypothetical protein
VMPFSFPFGEDVGDEVINGCARAYEQDMT